jgi:two-component system sensor histidine kinase PilS (NtrC family)
MPTDKKHSIAPRNMITVLSAYRLVIALLLLALFSIKLDTRLVGDLQPALFLGALLGYAAIHLVVLGLSFTSRLDHTRMLLIAGSIVDILILNLLIQASGDHSRPLSLLFVIAIVGSSMILPNRLSMLVAALATLSVLLQAGTRVLSHNLPASELATAGTLGLVFFITSFVVQHLVFRATRNEILAEQRAEDIEELQLLNEKIVQRMRTGIVVINDKGAIFLINESARNLLGLHNVPGNLLGATIPIALNKVWQEWSNNHQQLPPPFQIEPTGAAIQASFTPLSAGESGQSLVFLEDTRQVTQQAQAMKLGSLGRLTASIAHEIRNPLGAISHAAQLLSESPDVRDADLRFCEIIKTQSRRVNLVIENVLAVSRRDAPKPRQFDLNEYMVQFIQQYRDNSQHDPHITFRKSSAPIEINFDISQLDQVLTNLFDNGLRYSYQATGRYTLMVRIYIDETNELPQLDIIDQGPGIDADKMVKLFEPFYTTEHTGTGLGLYLAREMCLAHQTHLHYLKTDLNQSCFRLSFAHPRKRWLA